MAEFRICYENQKAEFVKKKIELGIPIILPSEVMQELETLGIDLPDKENDKDGKKKDKKSKKEYGKVSDKIKPSSILMIAIAVGMAALTGND